MSLFLKQYYSKCHNSVGAMHISNLISTTELLKKLKDQKSKIIDIRPIEAYNGWKLFNEKRGGHIITAKSLPFKWSNYIDWIEIIETKGILNEHELIIYGYNIAECEDVELKFHDLGYKNTKLYDHFVDEWSANESLPMERLAKYNHLVSAEWVHELIETGKAPEYANAKYVIPTSAHSLTISWYSRIV